MTYNNLPLYYIGVDDEELGMSAISLVDNPAVERNFLKFKKDYKFRQDYSQHIIFGPAIIPEKPIYRKDGEKEYYVCFSRNIIEAMVIKYSKQNLWNSVNLQHNDIPENNIIMISFFIKNSDLGIIPKYYEDLPDGTLFVAFKVMDEEVWERVKDGELQGFSIECLANLVEMPDDELDDYLD